jgi:tRNA A-37 threonylcarbamoyl transferase component Bud32
MNTFRKECSAKEIRLQKLAADLGIAPAVLETDNETYMVMERIPNMCVADFYGTSIRNLPMWVRDQIVNILYTLYSIHKIQYIDVTGYNFVEHEGKVWIIDFGDAYDDQEELHPLLKQIFAKRKLRWNKDFK